MDFITRNTWLSVVAALLFLTGCSANRPWNPSFPITTRNAAADLRAMSAEPVRFDRPVIIAGGYADVGLFTSGLVRRMRSLTTDRDQVVSVGFLAVPTFDACAERLITAVDERFGPGDSDTMTVEVDVIGFSMGGLIARHAARASGVNGRRLNIRRLFTISSPHRGSWLANLPTWDDRVVDMRAGSALLTELDAELPGSDYDLLAYGRRHDMIVGDVSRMAPPGRVVWWVPSIPFTLPHSMAMHDPRIIGDIARRLRSLPPHTADPPVSVEEARRPNAGTGRPRR